MAYKIMKKLITDRKKTKEELINMADVYYGAGRLTDEEYQEIITSIG